MKFETLLSQEDFFQDSSLHKNYKEKFTQVDFEFYQSEFIDIEQEYYLSYEEKQDCQNYQIFNKENITPQNTQLKCKNEHQQLSVIKEENQSIVQQSQQKLKNSTEIFKENFEQIYNQYDEEQEFLFSDNESQNEKQNFEDQQQETSQSQEKQKIEVEQQEQTNEKNKNNLSDSWEQIKKRSDDDFKNVKITKISSSEKNSVFSQIDQIQSGSSIQNTIETKQSLDEENSFLQIEKEIQNKNCFKKQFTITELQDEQIQQSLSIQPVTQDKSPAKEKVLQSTVNENDCAIFEIIKNSLLESKKPQNLFPEQKIEPNTENQQKNHLEKISINLDEDSVVEQQKTLEKQKRKTSMKKTIQRLLQKGEEYKNTLRKKTQEKKQQELKECSFTPKINQKKFIFNKQKEQSSFILSSKHLETMDKSVTSYKSQMRSTSNISRNYSKKNFIKENIKKLKSQKFGAKSEIGQKQVKIIKFEEPTFKPTINRKSSILAAKRKNSLTPTTYKKNRSQSMIQKPQKFKASSKSEKIIQKKILNKFYSVLIELQIFQETQGDYGDIPINKIQLFQICIQMKFFKISEKKFQRVSYKKKQFFENMFNKKLIPQEVYSLLTVLWDFLSEDGKNIFIRDLAFFILAIFGISVENEGEHVFDRKTLLKIQSSFKQFKLNSMRKEKIKSNKCLKNSKIDQLKSNNQKNTELASNYRSKLLDKYTDYITQGLLPMPKKQYLDHVDFLSLKDQIKEVELKKKRQINQQNSLNECTFSPLVNSQISHKTLQPYRLQEDYYESSKSVLKLEIKINGNNNETLFLCSEKDITKEVMRAQKKYNLKNKQVKKLQKVIKNQWTSYISNK